MAAGSGGRHRWRLMLEGRFDLFVGHILGDSSNTGPGRPERSLVKALRSSSETRLAKLIWADHSVKVS